MSRYLVVVGLTCLAVSCAEDSGGEGAGASSSGPFEGAGGGGGGAGPTRPPSSDAGAPRGEPDIPRPEQESFVVREVAATERFVFVPDSSEQSNTVARIDATSLSVEPLEVGGRPVAVRARRVEGVGAVAYVLTEGSSSLAVIRADDSSQKNNASRVSFVPVPEEVNALTLSPEGRHLIAYIDPDEPFPEDTSAASLQVLSVIRLGDQPSEDRSFRLSATRLIQEVEWTRDGKEAYVIGRNGINRLAIDELEGDAIAPRLDLTLDSSAFPPEEREVEVSSDGDLLVVRNIEQSKIALYRPGSTSGNAGTLRILNLPAVPTDIDLMSRDEGEAVVATLREAGQVALIDVDRALQSTSSREGVEIFDVSSTSPGLALATPSADQLLLYSTLELQPNLGILDLETRSTRSYRLRNQIRAVSLTSDGTSAVVVHDKQSGPPPSEGGALEQFQHRHGVTLVEVQSGYRRPVTLRANPEQIVMTQNDEGRPLLYAILQSDDPREQGLVRLDLSSYRRDFIRLPREPTQLGRVADQIYVSQSAERGRITFIDVNTGSKQTVSGYELNARIE